MDVDNLMPMHRKACHRMYADIINPACSNTFNRACLTDISAVFPPLHRSRQLLKQMLPVWFLPCAIRCNFG